MSSSKAVESGAAIALRKQFLQQSKEELIENLIQLTLKSKDASKNYEIPSIEEMEQILDEADRANKKVRIYVDGCWDLMHSGHYNAIRQSKRLGDYLVVGVHSDADIAKDKREPVMNNEERVAMVKACKWVDQVAFGVPYSPSLKILDELQIDYCAHGDDMPVNSEGKSAYAEVEHKLKIFKRTPGVSTTKLIDRLLLATNDSRTNASSKRRTSISIEKGTWSQFLATSHRLSAFSNQKVPRPNDTVVYIDGDWDLFHPGHVAVLKQAKALGAFLFVGVYDDTTVRLHKGEYWPMMGLQERALNLLSCRYVDEVIMAAPYHITSDMMKVLNIDKVATASNIWMDPNDPDLSRYGVPQGMKQFEMIEPIDSKLSTSLLVDRMISRHQRIQQQNRNRVAKEKAYTGTRTYIEEK